MAAALDDRDVSEVDMLKAAQIGWTYFLVAYLAKRIDTDPSPMIAMFAKEGDAKAFHEEKMVPAFSATPILKDTIDVSTSRKSGNTWYHKNFPGGFLKLVTSNSPGSVKSTSAVGVAVVEEPDDTSDDVKGQGDSIQLLEERLKRYVGSKMLVGGTPTIKGVSKMEFRVRESDMRVLPITCHACGENHVLDWENVTWQDKPDHEKPHEVYGMADFDTVAYACPDCGTLWDDYERQKNIRDTVQKAIDEGDPLCGWVPTRPFHGVAGFTELSELYVCMPGTSLADVVKDYLKAEWDADRGDIAGKVAFYNQKLGKAFEYVTNTPAADVLAQRAKDYAEMTVPEGGIVLTAGIDVQADRVAVVIRAWGVGMESWLIYFGELYAKVGTNDSKDPVWQHLSSLLSDVYEREDGKELRIRAYSIDAGYNSEQVYDFVRPRTASGARAVMGDSHDYGKKEIFSAPRTVDTRIKRRRTVADKRGVTLYHVGTHKAKDLIFGEGGRLSLLGDGPGRMHFYKDVRADYWDQITAFVKAPSLRQRGRLIWQAKAGQAHEAGDCEVYALHAAYSLGLNRLADSDWHALKQRQEDESHSKATQAAPSTRRRKSKFW